MKTIILNQRKERDELVSRPYLMRRNNQNVALLLNSHLIKLITGPRRVGKSTQALLMLRDKNFAYLNFDNHPLLDAWDADLVMRMLDEVYPGYEYILLDEVQNLDAWDLWVSELYRRGKNLVITGSNARMLSSEMATVLTGKYLQVEMLPFSLEEFFDWNKLDLHSVNAEQQTDAYVLMDDYLRNGGYPEVVASRLLTRSYLDTLFDSIIWKDVAKRHNVRNITDLNNLAIYLVSNFCNPISANELTIELGFSSVNTTKKYMDIPTSAFKELRGEDNNTYYYFCGSITDINTDNYEWDYSAIGYVTINGPEVYSGQYATRNIAYIANAALNDTSAGYTDDDLEIIRGYLPLD